MVTKSLALLQYRSAAYLWTRRVTNNALLRTSVDVPEIDVVKSQFPFSNNQVGTRPEHSLCTWAQPFCISRLLGVSARTALYAAWIPRLV
jgi:hypothetical protein